MPHDEQLTPHFYVLPAAMLVGVSRDLEVEVTAALSPLKILRVGHVAGACERMVATRPLVVVLEARPKDSELEALRATVLDISAQIVILSEYADPERRRAELIAARRAATQMRGEAP